MTHARSDEYLTSLYESLHRSGHLYQCIQAKEIERDTAIREGDTEWQDESERQLRLMRAVRGGAPQP